MTVHGATRAVAGDAAVRTPVTEATVRTEVTGVTVLAAVIAIAALVAAPRPVHAIERNCPRGQVWDANQGSCVKRVRADRRSPAEKYYEAIKHLERTARQPVPERGVALLVEACRARHAQACSLLGFLYKVGRHVSFDAALSLSHYERACSLDDPKGCLGAADVHSRGLPGNVDNKRAAELLERACDLDDGSGCYQLAEKYRRALGVDEDQDKARALFGKAFGLLEADCGRGVAPSCHLLGVAYKEGNGADANPRRALAAFDRGCKAGGGEACHEVGAAYELGSGTAQDIRKAYAIYADACARYDSANSCRDAGVIMVNGHVPMDAGALVEHGRRACDLDRRHCDLIAYLYDTGKGGEQDDARASDWYLAACERGNALACASAGHRAMAGTGTAKDPALAVELWSRACEGDHGPACVALGQHYLSQRARGSRKRAFELFHLGCLRRDPDACHIAAELLRDGRQAGGAGEPDPAPEPDRARLYYVASCELGNGPACVALAALHRGGDKGFARKPDEALALYERACAMGFGDGCTEIGQMYYRGEGVAKDQLAAALAFQRACVAGADQPCWWIDSVMRGAEAADEHRRRAVATLERACAGPDGHDGGADGDGGGDGSARNETACLVLGAIYAYGGFIADKDGRRGFRMFREACDRKHHPACVEVAQCYSHGIGVVKDTDKAEQMLVALCDGEAPVACGLLADLLWREKQYARAAQLSARACDEGHANACNLIGFAYYTAQGERWDIEQAVKYYERACELDLPVACANVGELYEYGIGKPRDLDKALTYYQKGCTPTVSAGCGRVGRFYEQGLGGAEVDLERAEREYERACADEAPEACRSLAELYKQQSAQDAVAARQSAIARLTQRALDLARELAADNPYGHYLLGGMYRDGFAVRRDLGQAAEHFGNACDGFDPLGCINAGRILLEQARTPADYQAAALRFDRACAAVVEDGCALAAKAREQAASEPDTGQETGLPLPVTPRRGCACDASGDAGSPAGAGWFALLVLALAVSRRRLLARRVVADDRF